LGKRRADLVSPPKLLKDRVRRKGHCELTDKANEDRAEMIDQTATPKRRFLPSLAVTRIAGAPWRGRISCGASAISCALGASGITRRKREGDGSTPAGRFKMVKAFFRPNKNFCRPCGLMATAIRKQDGWCDDPHDGRYNRQVRLPFRSGHEALWRDDGLYDVIIVLDYNFRPRISGRGSAIFLHLARRNLAPTAGCVAVSSADMRRLLPQISQYTVIDIR
jgi:L,D-peptidoglycan transpeptidase YkuD (ErfK/YbiS/YcfS/YnhG family)